MRTFRVSFDKAGKRVQRVVNANFAKDAAEKATERDVWPLTQWEPEVWRTSYVDGKYHRDVWVTELS